MKRVPAWIGGEKIYPDKSFETIDPASGEVLAEVAHSGATEVEDAVGAARECLPRWSLMPPTERANVLHKMASLIRRDLAELAEAETRDTGKPISQATTDATVAARYFDYYANTLEAFFGKVIPTGEDITAVTRPLPFGVTAHIIPWNYPMQILCRTIAPALAVGNCCVVKPAEEAPLTSYHIGLLAREAGLPDGALNIVPGFGESAGNALASSSGIDHLSFTGSVEVGKLVAAAAAANVVPTALELGGKSPNVVMADADLDEAIPAITRAVIQNAGQTCSAGSRLIVDDRVHGEVVERLRLSFSGVRMGPGLSDPDLGPLISADQRQRVVDLLKDAGEPIAGGRLVEDPKLAKGYFFPATLFDQVDPDSELAQEEVFGPVLAVFSFRNVDEAIELANGSDYGLIAGVWTSDIDTAHRLSSGITAGQVYINAYGAGGGVELPFGGFKRSGYGREKGFEALASYTQTKTIITKHRL